MKRFDVTALGELLIDFTENGNLVINPDEAFTVRMIFYLFLYGFPLHGL